MKILVTLITFFPLLLGFILATIWWTREKNFEPLLTALGLLATITGIFAERWATAYEKRVEFMRALLNECRSNEAILSDNRFNSNSHKPGRPVVFPRLIVSVTETALASGVFAERKDRELFSLLHQWRHTVNEFNRRLDITELRVFTNPLPQEINSLYEALQESKEFNDAVTLTRAIESIVSSQYPDKFKPFGALLSNVNRTT
ncbi:MULTISPECIES: hypothetical protein [Nostocales]|uniref:Uncharacterized protein n=3 Tax=Nostocales TaxID=1161 RepID=A0A0C1R5S0_9CYAN|nr:hypothetical protein [Tolypothrix bouteillei]KAF3888789.1 hypothetical protein DA73_0400027360 [Tolypothrix bouteillei VB521301]